MFIHSIATLAIIPNIAIFSCVVHFYWCMQKVQVCAATVITATALMSILLIPAQIKLVFIILLIFKKLIWETP